MQIRVPKQRRMFASEWNCNSRRLFRSKACWRVLSAFSIVLILLISNAAAQETDQVSHNKDQEKTRENEKTPSASARLGRRPIEWLIGLYIPVQEPLRLLPTASVE